MSNENEQQMMIVGDDITEDDIKWVTLYMRKYPHEVLSDYALVISKAGNLCIRKVSAETRQPVNGADLCVIKRNDTYRIISECEPAQLASEVTSAFARKSKPVMPKYLPAVISEEELENIKSAVAEIVAYHKTCGLAIASWTVQIPKEKEDSVSIVVEMEPDSIWHISSKPIIIKKKAMKIGKKSTQDLAHNARQRLGNTLSSVTLSDYAKKNACAKIKDLISTWKKEHPKEIAAYGKNSLFMNVLGNSIIDTVINVMDTPYDDFSFSTKNGKKSIQVTATLSKYWKNAIVIEFPNGIEGGCGFDSATRTKLSKYLWAAQKKREIIDVISRLDDSGLHYTLAQKKKHVLSLQLQGKYSTKDTEISLDQPYKRTLNALIKNFKEEEANAADREQHLLIEHPLTGQVLAHAIAVVAYANRDFITPSAVAKRMRGLTLKQDKYLEKTRYDGKFERIPTDDIKDTIDELAHASFLYYHYVSGRYSRYGGYYIVKPTEHTLSFIEACENTSKLVKLLGKKNASTRELVFLETLKTSIGDEPRKERLDIFEYIMEHPALLCEDDECISAWLEKATDAEMSEYIALRIKLEDNRHRKSYFK